MALPWLPCSQRRPLVARISPKPAAASRLFWLGRDCHVERRAAAAHRQIAMFVGVGAHFDARSGGILGRTPAAQIARGPEAVCDSLVRRARRRQRRGVAARAASALPTHGSAGGQHYRCLCASRGRSSPDRLPGGGGGERSRVCAAGPLSRATARLPPPPPPRVRAALGSLLQPHRRGRRVRRSRQGACPKGESLLTRRARFAAAPLPSHAAAAAVSPHATCCRESPAADYSTETWRSAVRPAAVAAARSPCPGARRVDPATPPPSAGHARLAPAGACCRSRRDPVRGAFHCLDGSSASGVGARSGARPGRMPALSVCPRRCAAELRAVAVAHSLTGRSAASTTAWPLARPLRAANTWLGRRAAPSPLAGQPRPLISTPSLWKGRRAARACVRVRAAGRRRGRCPAAALL